MPSLEKRVEVFYFIEKSIETLLFFDKNHCFFVFIFIQDRYNIYI